MASRAWLVVPRGEVARRLTLLGVIVALQNLLEVPRGLLLGPLGARLTSVMVMLALGGSLALLVVALRAEVPRWRWLSLRSVQIGVLLATLAAVPTGLHQLGSIAAMGFGPPNYPNDGTTIDHYAAIQVIEGHDPYVTSNIAAAVRKLKQDPARTTPLRTGAFAKQPASSYPTAQQLRSTFAAETSVPGGSARDFESHVSYPALAFLPLVPLVKLGLPNVEPFFALCFLALAGLLLLSVPASLRPWIGLLIVADAPLLDATVAGDLDVFYVLLLFVAWRWWQRPVTAALAFGLALAAKQLAWFYLPFYVIRVGRALGWRQAIGRLAGAGAVFAVINAPYVLANPRAWVAGVLAPEIDPMFPLGNGVIRLSLAGILPLWPSGIYGLLELLALVACVVWYWRVVRTMPEAGMVLAVVPLFFAWRSLSTYFYFAALPAVALLFSRRLGTDAAWFGRTKVGLAAARDAVRLGWRPASNSSAVRNLSAVRVRKSRVRRDDDGQ